MKSIGCEGTAWLDRDESLDEKAHRLNLRKTKGLGFLEPGDPVRAEWERSWPQSGNVHNWDAVGCAEGGIALCRSASPRVPACQQRGRRAGRTRPQHEAEHVGQVDVGCPIRQAVPSGEGPLMGMTSTRSLASNSEADASLPTM